MNYIAGAGNDYLSVADIVPLDDYFLLDGDFTKIGKLIHGKTVYDYTFLRQATELDVVYISSSNYFEQIKEAINRVNREVKIDNLAKLIWESKAEEIKNILSTKSYQYNITLDVNRWVEAAFTDETAYWNWAVKNAVNLNDDRIQEREFEYREEKIQVSEDSVILDIGCGPLPKFGNLIHGKRIAYHPTDPLAFEYKKILDKYKVDLPVEPEFAIGEILSTFFEENSADYVIMHNALDHCIDPLRVLCEMLKVCKIGGNVLLFHADSEGVFENYSGMHKWNITEADGSMYIFDQNHNVLNLTEYIKDFAELEVKRVPLNYRDAIACKIEKRDEIPEKIEKSFSEITGDLIKSLFEKIAIQTINGEKIK